MLVVNADDFGRSAGVNRGIVRAHEHGIVTSASLMVRWPAAAEAARYARTHPELGVGLHVDLGEWVYRDERWDPVYDLRVATAADAAAEVCRQLDVFRELVGRDPTHVDSHQHVHREEPARSAALAVGRELGVPVRDATAHARYVGDFFGQTHNGMPLPDAIAVEALVALLRSLPDGASELGCHPGDPTGLNSSYREERLREVETLCDPRVRAVVEEEGIELRSFEALGAG